MLEKLKEIKNSLKRYLPVALLGLSSGNVAATPFQGNKVNQPPKSSVVLPISKSAIIQSKLNYEFLKETLNDDDVTYVIDAKKWRNEGKIELKKVNKDQIMNYDLTTVMQQREGRHGDAVNVNKSKTRILTCQANVTIAKHFLRYMYCSKNKELHNFAAKYIANNVKNTKIKQQVENTLFDENGEFKMGENTIKSRNKALTDMMSINVTGIAAGTQFTTGFLNDLKIFDKNHHDTFMQAQKDFVVAIYPAFNIKNIPAQKAHEYAQKNNLRDASCIPVGTASLYTSSLIAYGAYSRNTLNNERVTTQNAKKVNSVDYITLDAARQMAIAGYSGADKLYYGAMEKINANNNYAQTKSKVKHASRTYISMLNDLKKTSILKPQQKQINPQIINSIKRRER